jgi:hypothetical protein
MAGDSSQDVNYPEPERKHMTRVATFCFH